MTLFRYPLRNDRLERDGMLMMIDDKPHDLQPQLIKTDGVFHAAASRRPVVESAFAKHRRKSMKRCWFHHQ